MGSAVRDKAMTCGDDDRRGTGERNLCWGADRSSSRGSGERPRPGGYGRRR
ncbi:hypothetical protein Ae168Ps1_4019c [Pseudonocardia sp. Ae168_Ps1]|nr:hypothetical protein Ae168Ps1_4019c [Pseudonocardia sp. Ae168_Ps1]